MRDHILVIGGYGHVGNIICRKLGSIYPGKVIAAGRSMEKAEEFSRTTNGRVKPLQLNIEEPVNPALLQDIKLVVMCVDQSNPTFARACFAQGMDYLDISANYDFLAQVERLHEEAVANQTTAVLSVGLAPGLTNLLARLAKSQLDHIQEIDITVMLGLGDQHGTGAIEWTVDNLGTGVQDRKITDFGEELGRRTAFRFNFSDQYVIPRTLGVPSVSTRLCFDSSMVTRCLGWLNALGVFRLLKQKRLRQGVVHLLGAIRFGKAMVAIKVDAQGIREGEEVRIESTVIGEHEADITAKVAAWVADTLYRMKVRHGVFHLEQLFAFEDVWQGIGDSISFSSKITRKK